MTDKQIIIDGVDVSGCPHYKTGDCLISPVWCDQFYNCDYKQFKRAEKSMLYIWSECVLEIVSAKQYKDIQKLFEERIKNVQKM